MKVFLRLILLIVYLCGYVTSTPMTFDGFQYLIIDEEERESKPFTPITESWKKEDTLIYIGISAFRDK